MNIRYFSLLLVFTLLLLVSSSASAVLDYKDKEMIDADTVIDDDLLIYGNTVDIRGTVLGDVTACGGSVRISGNVTGDVMACGGKVTISGIVGDDVRIGAGEVVIEGNVGDDVFVGAGSVVVSEGAYIGGDMFFGSGRMEARGEVAGNIEGGAGDVILAGPVGGNVDLEVGTIEVLSPARINGTLEYTSQKRVTFPPGTVIQDVVFTEKEPHDRSALSQAFSLFIGWFVRLFHLLIIALLVLVLLPDHVEAVARNIPKNPLLNIAMGFALVVIGFVGSLVFMVTVIGIPIGLIVLFLTIFTLYAARLYFGLWLGRRIYSQLGKESRPWMDMVLGVLVLSILTSLPWVGGLVYLVVTFMVIGVMFSTMRGAKA
ncbi:MAG: polymer-forming cytoskeletal protein [ANME-2 cluster archaeon]|nr:polymer-forming cytoskeletal protein [ANME-2 cluster archaeon]